MNSLDDFFSSENIDLTNYGYSTYEFDLLKDQIQQQRKESKSQRTKREASNSNSSNLDFLNKHIFSEATPENTENYGCREDLEEIRLCPNTRTEDKCWNDWSEWSDCDCSSDTRQRHRSCPVYGNCEGEDFEEEDCRLDCDVMARSLENSLSCFSCENGSSNEECISSATMCSSKSFRGTSTNSTGSGSNLYEVNPNGYVTNGNPNSPETSEMGCQSQTQVIDGQTKISKSCQNIVDCYIESADKLSSGECDPSNPLHSNCIYCCEDEYCNYDSHFESSFYLILKMANFRRSKLSLKSAGRLGSGGGGSADEYEPKSRLSRSAVSEMYKEYKNDKENIDLQLKQKRGSRSGKGLKKLIDIAVR